MRGTCRVEGIGLAQPPTCIHTFLILSVLLSTLSTHSTLSTPSTLVSLSPFNSLTSFLTFSARYCHPTLAQIGTLPDALLSRTTLLPRLGLSLTTTLRLSILPSFSSNTGHDKAATSLSAHSLSWTVPARQPIQPLPVAAHRVPGTLPQQWTPRRLLLPQRSTRSVTQSTLAQRVTMARPTTRVQRRPTRSTQT